MRLLLLPGDGIGPELITVTRAVLEQLDARFRLNLQLLEHDIGLSAHAATGSTFPAATLALCKDVDGIVLAPADTYAYPTPSEGGVNPSAVLRGSLDLYANIRPAKTIRGVPSVAKAMDLVIVRENTEGFYADRNMFQGLGEFMPTEEVALSVRKITRKGSMRIAHTAFKLAETRRKHVTVVHKANVLKVTDGLFKTCVNEIGNSFSDVELDESLIDAMTARLVRAPQLFDVVVTSNMYGDILSDLSGELAGGLGLSGALNVGDEHAMAQATHGSAPDIAGQGIANPAALLLSTAMLLQWLGERHGDSPRLAGDALTAAVHDTLADSTHHTPDLGGSSTTNDFGSAVVDRLNQHG